MAVKKVVIIGSSAGGPRVLRELFDGLPRLNGAIILIQHMPRFINESIRDTIRTITKMDVHLIEDGAPLKDHSIYIAPSEIHTKLVHNETFRLFEGERYNYVKPSVDVVMQSVEQNHFEKIMGIILTGMGRDGADGICHLKALGATTIAQDEESCVIFGMPKEAIQTGCVDFVLEPMQIRTSIISALGTSGR